MIGGGLSKTLNLGGPKFKGWPKILGGGGTINIVGKGGHTPPILEIQDAPTFHRSLSKKQKYWITLVINLYIISTLKVS